MHTLWNASMDFVRFVGIVAVLLTAAAFGGFPWFIGTVSAIALFYVARCGFSLFGIHRGG